MKTLTLKLKSEPEIPVELDVITPDNLAGKSLGDIKKLIAYEGKFERELGELFDIKGDIADDPAEMEIIIESSSSKLKRMGEKMKSGKIEIKGDAGMHLGDSMSGGTIIVTGNIEAYAGSEMTGGTIHAKGNAGNYIGCAYRGNWRGMRGGKIVIEGDAGFEVGAWLRGTKKTRAKGEPLIHVKGNIGLHAGHHNHGGFMIIDGNSEGRTGSEMARGAIVIGGEVDLLSTYIKDPDTVSEIPGLGLKGSFTSYTGDKAIDGKGKIYLKQ